MEDRGWGREHSNLLFMGVKFLYRASVYKSACSMVPVTALHCPPMSSLREQMSGSHTFPKGARTQRLLEVVISQWWELVH